MDEADSLDAERVIQHNQVEGESRDLTALSYNLINMLFFLYITLNSTVYSKVNIVCCLQAVHQRSAIGLDSGKNTGAYNLLITPFVRP